MRKIKISVLTPVYNTPLPYLKEMMESVLSQTYSDFEFIILNDSPENIDLEKQVLSYRKYLSVAPNVFINSPKCL